MSHNTSLSELPSFAEYERTDEDTPLSWDFDLPSSVDSERIVVNTSHLTRLQKIAAFSANHVFSYQGRVTEYDAAIDGINPNGTALLARRLLRTVKPEPSKEKLIDAHENLEIMLASHTTQVMSTLNKSEMVRVVSDIRQRTDKSAEEAWATVLDDHLQQSIRKAAYKHLLDRTEAKGKVTEVFPYVSIAFLMNNLHILNEQDLSETLIQGGGAMIGFSLLMRGMNLLSSKGNHGNSFFKEQRWSFFTFMQPERYVALDALTRVAPLIKSRK
jgi:hypothetical protein